MAAPADRAHLYLRVGVYVFLYLAALMLFARAVVSVGGLFLGVTVSQLLAALAANLVALRIYGRRSLADLGLGFNGASLRHLALGIAAGMGSAALTLAPPLAAHAARLLPDPGARAGWDIFLFTAAGLAAGSAGEEVLFRGYGFQMLLRAWGPHTAIFTVGALFAVLHGGNPNSTWLGLLNTAGFGILFGYAFLRSGDIWLPIGLHFGWNFTLPLFGVNVSGLTMRLTGYRMEWSADTLWSGGPYGPEASILATAVLAVLAVFLWKAPLRRQAAPLIAGEF